MLDNLCIKPSNKISTYNMDFMHYVFQLGWGNSVLYYCYYQRLPNQIKDPISTWEQRKPTLSQNIYALTITINHYYWKYDCKYHYVRQAKKEALESHSQKQEKASTSSPVTASQNKTNTSLVASSTKTIIILNPKSGIKKQLLY